MCGGNLAAESLDLDPTREVFEYVDDRVDIGFRAQQRHAGRIGTVLIGEACATNDLQLVEFQGVQRQACQGVGAVDQAFLRF